MSDCSNYFRVKNRKENLMADWSGVSRSNYFRVKNRRAFTKAMGDLDLRVVQDGRNKVAVISEAEYGDFTSEVFNKEKDEYEEVDIIARIAEHLVDGEVCVLMSAGAEGERYVTGIANAFTNQGEVIHISLDDIYAKAEKAFGAKPTLAEY